MSGLKARIGKGGAWWIAMAFFLISVAPGLWLTSLPNILKEQDAEWVLPYAFAAGPLASLFSPLIFGSMADNRFSAQKLMGTLSLLGAGFLGLSFYSLYSGWGPWAYIAFQTMNALISAPMWALLSTVALANLDNPERAFPLYRIWGTIGWILAGLTVSFFALDSAPMSGMIASGVRVLLGLACFMMPETLPLGKRENNVAVRNWRRYFGLDALVLFNDRGLRVFLITSILFAIPLAAFYMYTPIHLKELGDTHPVASMTLGQVTEIVAMLVLSGLLAKWRLRWVLIIAIGFALVRYLLYALAGWSGSLTWIWLGIAMHGPCYTFYYVTGQILVNRRVEPEIRSQAQALLGTLTNGIGGLIGSAICGLYYAKTINMVNGWVFFWGGLAAAVLGCGVYFYTSYERPTHRKDAG
ncbi:MFS transporter [Oceaniferula spumae]|uniref:MFS transporter n=1 Tax=Oceaniferula spumae TaxID=2979115 RepID=UPI003F4F30B2